MRDISSNAPHQMALYAEEDKLYAYTYATLTLWEKFQALRRKVGNTGAIHFDVQFHKIIFTQKCTHFSPVLIYRTNTERERERESRTVIIYEF